MIIVTPSVGSVPEPRPQALITGDRAVTLLADGGVSTTALTKAGVQLVTVTKTVYDELTSQLTDEGSPDVDPTTGLIKETLLPARLSAAAISALNLLDPLAHTVAEAYVPARLSTSSLTTLIGTVNGTQLVTDPDGTPVVIGGGNTDGISVTYTGTVTGATVTAGTLHGDLFTANSATIAANEVGVQLFDNQSATPAAPPANKITSYSDGNGRLSYKDPTNAVFLVGTKRIVSAWPAVANSVLGDEAILAATGEHRIYKGTTLGWRLASPHSVSSLADRNAITNKYVGMKVFCTFGVAQDHVWGADNQWHGTKAYAVQGGAVRSVSGVNNTNFQRWNETAVADPGYPYLISGRLGVEVAQQGVKSRVEIWIATVDQVTGANYRAIAQTFRDDPSETFHRLEVAIMDGQVATPEVGNRLITVDWRCLGNNANAYSGPYQAWNDYLVHPV